MANNQYFSDATQAMIRHVRQHYPHLSHPDEIALFTQWQETGNKKAMDRIVLSHINLALKMVRKLLGYGLPADDLLGQAIQGMQRALAGFDASKGFRFSTFASRWIFESMMTYIMRNVRPTMGPQTATAKTMFFHLNRVRRELDIHGPLSESDAVRVREHLKLTLPSAENLTVKSIMDSDAYLSSSFVSADTSAPGRDGEDSPSLLDGMADTTPSAEERLADKQEEMEQSGLLKQAMNVLNERQRDVFYSRRLLEPYKTLDDLGLKYGVSRERIRQIEARAFEMVSARVKTLLRERQNHAFNQAQQSLLADKPGQQVRTRTLPARGVRNPFKRVKSADRPRAHSRVKLSQEELSAVRSEASRRGNQSRTPEQRSLISLKANQSRTPEQRSLISLKGNQSRTPEQRRQISLKSAETLKRKRAEQAAANASGSGGSGGSGTRHEQSGTAGRLSIHH